MINHIELLYTRHNRLAPAAAISNRPIPFYDMTVMLKGSLSCVIDGQPYTVKEGEVLLMPPGSLRARYRSREEVDYISFNFNVDPAPDLPMHFSAAKIRGARLLYGVLDEILRHPAQDNTEAIRHLLACLLSVYEQALHTEAISPLTAQITEYLHTHLASRVTLADISRITFFSPVYCDTVFKRDTGKSIIEYLLSERIAEAKRRLAEGADSLTELALSLGFTDYNYFARVFKKRTGYTPSAYRKALFLAP